MVEWAVATRVPAENPAGSSRIGDLARWIDLTTRAQSGHDRSHAGRGLAMIVLGVRSSRALIADDGVETVPLEARPIVLVNGWPAAFLATLRALALRSDRHRTFVLRDGTPITHEQIR